MSRWGKLGISLFIPCVFLTMAGVAAANLVTFKVVPSLAPKGPASRNWDNYVVNALSGLQNDMDLLDRAMTPAAYERVTTAIKPQEIIHTPFNSWRGKAAPSSDFGEPFLGEFGNRVHFGLHVVASDGWDFSIHDLTWELDSNDASNHFDQSGDFGAAGYSSTRIGIHYGADGVKGGPDDRLINSGPGDQRVNELLYVGVGDGFESNRSAATDNQQDINETIASLRTGCADVVGDCFVDLTATYTLPDPNGGIASASGTVRIQLIPEPSAIALIVIGIACSLAKLRKRC